MATLGSQIGQLLERRRAEAQAKQAGERQRAIVEAALDCIVTVDERGRVLEFNPAAVRTFGYRAEEAIGQEMAELLIPPDLREDHREGFAPAASPPGRPAARIARGDHRPARVRQRVPDRAGHHPDRRPGPPRFTGFLRDITERHRIDEDLRPSRRASSRRPTRPAGGSSGICTTARSSGWCLALGLRLARAQFSENPAAAGGSSWRWR